MERSNQLSRLLLVNSAALPDVFARVVDAKELLVSGKATSASEAARQAGISRSAFYKYKDSVFSYDEYTGGRTLTVQAELRDHPGILSGVLTAFATAGANILTVNQNIPSEGKALVTISARIDRPDFPVGDFICTLSSTKGVERVARISREDD